MASKLQGNSPGAGNGGPPTPGAPAHGGSASPLERVLAPYSEHAYAALRMVLGSLFAFHGMQKILGVLSTHQPPVMSQVWIGGVIELIAGALITVGLFTRVAAFLASGTMAVAYIQFHWKFQFDAKFFPAVNRGELAAVYCFAFLFMATRGAGALSIDRAWRARRAGAG